MTGLQFDGTALTVIGLLLSALAGTVTKLFYMLIASKDQEKQVVIDQLEIYKGIVADSLYVARQANNRRREAIGQPKIELVADVVPEHNSPTTDEQREIANLATARAELTALSLDLDLPPRVEAEHEEQQAQWKEQNRELVKQVELVQKGIKQSHANEARLQELTSEVDETVERVDETTQRIEDKQEQKDQQG